MSVWMGRLATLLLLLALPALASSGGELQRRTLTMTDMGHQHSLAIQGSTSSVNLGFGLRMDEVVEDANWLLNYTVSPALEAKLSHLKIYLNGELQGVVEVVAGQQGRAQQLHIPLDTRYLSRYNQLRIELVGRLDKQCWNIDDPSIWAEIGHDSQLELGLRKLAMGNDLQHFPVPFFDSQDNSRLTLPMILPADYAIETLRAAAVAASYFGSLAQWRGSDFPVLIDELPSRNAIVFMSNEQRPAFLRDYPAVDMPTLQMITHPQLPGVKLLLVQGRDARDLNTAIRGLALGEQLLSGPLVTVAKAEQVLPRQPYDAPNWIATDRPVSIAELVDDVTMLQARGRKPQPIKLSLRLPPDLFTWQSRGIPLDLHYRYTPAVDENLDSQLSVSINRMFVEGFPLTSKGVSDGVERLRVPLLGEALFDRGERMRIPAFRVGANNELAFKFAFASTQSGACKTNPANAYSAVLEADSTIDFSRYPHYIQMPNLRAFAGGAFPFSKYADLSTTKVVMAASPSRHEAHTLLQLMGFVGASTGYPALAVELVAGWQPAQLEDSDILAIGVSAELATGDAPLLLETSRRLLSRPHDSAESPHSVWSRSAGRPTAEQVNIEASGAFAALVGMESPVSSGHSLLAVLAAHPQDLTLVTQALSDSGKLSQMYGSVVTFRGDSVNSYQVGDNYFLGELPLVQLIWYYFSKHPLLLSLLVILLVLLLAVAVWRALAVVAARRVREREDDE